MLINEEVLRDDMRVVASGGAITVACVKEIGAYAETHKPGKVLESSSYCSIMHTD